MLTAEEFFVGTVARNGIRYSPKVWRWSSVSAEGRSVWGKESAVQGVVRSRTGIVGGMAFGARMVEPFGHGVSGVPSHGRPVVLVFRSVRFQPVRREDRMFADRLNMLFEDSPRFGRPVTQAVVADGLEAGGRRISRPYLSQLRRGLRTSPSPDVVAVLADYFGVDHEYFFRPVGSESADPSEVIDRLEQGPLRRLLSCVDGLSESSAGLVLDMAERLRRAEKRPTITAGEPTDV